VVDTGWRWSNRWKDEPKTARYKVVKETERFIYIDTQNPEPPLEWWLDSRVRHNSKTARINKNGFNGYFYLNKTHRLVLFKTRADAEAYKGATNFFKAEGSENRVIEKSMVILKLAPGYSLEELKSAYRKKAQKTHPDHGGTGFEKVHAAYEILKADIEI
jgi:hypothetical protein